MKKCRDVMAAKQFQVDFEPIGKRVKIDGKTSLFSAARRAGIALTTECGGQGKCGQCQVQIIDGCTSPPAPREKLVFTAEELDEGYRLACRTTICGNTRVNVPRSSQVTEQRLQISGISQPVDVHSIITAHQVAMSAPTLEDLHPDAQRLDHALEEKTGVSPWLIEPAVVGQLSRDVRQHKWRLIVFTRGVEVVGIAPPDVRPLGVAVDLGTTKLAAYLIDLQSGEELAAAGAANPQISYGEDVISRLAYVRRNKFGAKKMAGLIRKALNDLIGELVEKAGMLREQIGDLVIVGNTAMTHLLLHLPVEQLALSPFVAATGGLITIKARDLDLHTAPGAEVMIPPIIGGFVGADAVAMIIASDLDRSKRITIGIDIGTNTEMALMRPDTGRMYALSCPSGPAFEGAHIGDGMRAAAGAIEAVKFDASHIILKTIDDAPPVGLCGSGIVDAVAELYRWHVINARGRFDANSERVREGRNGPELVLAPAVGDNGTRDVVITQADVNEIQLAKGAIRAGLDVLLAETDTALEDVAAILVAGAFGSFLDLESALDMGLLPRFPNATYRQIGNAAVIGAQRALVSHAERGRLQTVVRQTEYIELTTHPRFRRLFALGMLFPQNGDSQTSPP